MIVKKTLHQVNVLKKDPTAPYAIYVENKSSSHLVIYFGSHNGEFRGTSTIQALNCNAIFMRSNHATWYLEDIPTLGATPEEVSQTINNHIKAHPHIKTVTLAGFSMGAFAALLYSTWINATKVVATAPQTIYPTHDTAIGITNPFWLKYSVISELWKEVGHPSCETIIQCCAEIDPNEVWRDIEEAELLEPFEHVTLHRYPCKGHKGISPLLLANTSKYESTFLCD